MLACVRLLAQRRTASVSRRERLDLRRLQQAVASAAARMPIAATAAARVAARTAFRAAADALQAHLGLGLGYILCSQLADYSTGPKADRNAQREATS